MTKLSTKVVQYFAFASLFVFVLGSLTFYLLVKGLIAEEVDETLISEKKRILTKLAHESRPVPNWDTINMKIRPVNKTYSRQESWNDTLIFVKETNENIPMRQLRFFARVNDQTYQITLRRSLIEKEDLITGVFGVMVGIFVMMIVILNIVNIYSDRKLWKPFYTALNELNAFELSGKRPLQLPESTIKEFNQLNKTLNALTQKIQNDYRNLKEFSENAAHEMQTPLAVIRSKLDVLIQNQSLSKEQMQIIQSLYQAVNRLARLNQSLNLLTKIENREFNEKQSIDFNSLIDEQLKHLEELIGIKQIRVQRRYQERFIFDLNPFMAETLISNLLINALKHNIPEGFIEIATTKSSLQITNSGPHLKSDPQKMFERFKKDRPTSDSPGLGLSIVQSICQQNGLDVFYQYEKSQHMVAIKKHEPGNKD